MRIVNPSRDHAAQHFATAAAEYFKNDPKAYTYADGDPKAGMFLAIRWNSYTVMVVELAEQEPLLFPTSMLIGCDLPKMEGGQI